MPVEPPECLYANAVHIRVMNKLEEKEKYELDNFMAGITNPVLPSYHEITGKHFRSVFVAAKHHWSQNSHNDLIKLQKMNFGQDAMGTQCASKQAAKKMLIAISEVYKRDLILMLQNNEIRFSLIVDDSTDFNQNHFMVCLFQFVTPAGEIEVFFYDLINIKDDGTAQGHVDEFRAQMVKDQLWDIAKDRLVAVVSDGASVMRGWRNGFVAKLMESFGNGRKIYSHHCLVE